MSLASSTAAVATTTRRSPRRASAAAIGRMPGHGTDLAAQGQLADEGDPPRTRPELLRAEQDADRHREIERRARFPQVRRREVDRDPSRRMDESGVAQRAANTLACLLERGVGEADDREPGQPRRDVDLDPDQPAVEAVERRGWDDGQHAPQPTGGRSPHRQRRITARLIRRGRPKIAATPRRATSFARSADESP